MPYAILALIGFQLLGDMIADLTSVPVPGMVIGLVLLLAVLWIRGRTAGTEHAVPAEFQSTAKVLHDNLGLLFVPAGAGVMANLSVLATDAIGLFAAVLVSTMATIAVSGLIAGWRRAPATVPALVPR